MELRLRNIVFVCVLLAVSGIVYFGYFCPDQVCALTKRESGWSDLGLRFIGDKTQANLVAEKPGLSYDEVLNDNFQFDMNAHDVMVFLHIQKTGGTSFGRHLVRDLDLERPCTCQRKRKRCYCFRPGRNENWLFSRYSTGWKCGLHADWTELTSCVDTELDKNEGEKVKRRYFYITLLREPISRYLSEFRHVQRGATWRGSRHFCGGHSASAAELPRCYKGDTWWGVTLEEFARCPHNLAANRARLSFFICGNMVVTTAFQGLEHPNMPDFHTTFAHLFWTRQTRMLADLALVGCYNASFMTSTERDRVMLASAKANLASMAYFGLTELQKENQYVFEETFNLRFAVPFEQHNATLSSITMTTMQAEQLNEVRKLNALDLELYDFARKLMDERFARLRARDREFAERFAHLGELPGRAVGDAFNWDSVLDNDDDENVTRN